MTPTQNPQGIRVDIDSTTPYVCAQCNNDVFLNGFYVRKVSRLISGGDKDGILPISVLICSKCGIVAEDLLPESLQKKSTIK
jgi:DNA-directed RNA polymerase subunit RPC12/RpoP